MKILVAGPERQYAVYRPDFADELPVELVFRGKDQSIAEAAEENRDAEILFVDAVTRIDGAVMDLLPNLKMIQMVGVAHNLVDGQAARERGIYLCNNKACNAESVAEQAIMLMLMALRSGVTGHQAVVEGRQFQTKLDTIAAGRPGLFQCSVGLIGFGDIAQATARRLAGFGCKLYYYTAHRRSSEIEDDFGVTYLPLEELIEKSDIISLHCAVNEETFGMVNREFLSKMKKDAVLVNCARGALIDNDALRDALIQGTIGCAALDTIEPEPTPGDHPLVDLPVEAGSRVVYSPHLGGSSSGAFIKAHRTMWQNAGKIIWGERPDYVVNGL